MTCIVAITTPTNVYIGGDRSISDDVNIISSSRPKVNKINNWIFGYAGSIGTGQLFEFFNFPQEVDDPYKVLRLNIVEQYRMAIESFGNNDDDTSAEFLIGYGNKLFEFNTVDWSVIQIDESSIGSGSSIAFGSLYTTKTIYTDTSTRVRMAIEAAIHYSPTCKGPVDIIYT